MKHKFLIMLVLVFSCGAIAGNIYAGQGAAVDWKEKADKAAQKAIDQCWAISQDDKNSGVTARMRDGGIKTAMCLKEHILKLSAQVLFKKDAARQKEVADELQQIYESTGRMYWLLNNEHDACTIEFCGTMYTIFHADQMAVTMENILRDFYLKIAEYERAYGDVNKLKLR